MSSSERGRHKAGRHAAPKKPRTANKHVGALFSIASVGTVAVTGSSSIAHSQSHQSTVLADPAPTSGTQTVSPTITLAASTRAQAASRSDNRTTLTDVQDISQASNAADPAADPNAVIDTSPTVNSNQRRALAAVATTTDDLSAVVNQAQQQAATQAQRLVALQQQQKAAAEQATADAAQALLAAQEAADIGVRSAPIHGSYNLTARFGQRGSLWSLGWHTGLDFQVPVGTSVYPCAAGKIIFAGWAGAYGNRIEVQHPDGYVTAYNHLSKIEVSSGIVLPSTEIAKSGATGNVTGPHVHLEVTKDGNFQNPATWLWGSNR